MIKVVTPFSIGSELASNSIRKDKTLLFDAKCLTTISQQDAPFKITITFVCLVGWLFWV